MRDDREAVPPAPFRLHASLWHGITVRNETAPRQRRRGAQRRGAARTPNTSRSATRAALSPHCPCTAGPGGVAAEAR